MGTLAYWKRERQYTIRRWTLSHSPAWGLGYTGVHWHTEGRGVHDTPVDTGSPEWIHLQHRGDSTPVHDETTGHRKCIDTGA